MHGVFQFFYNIRSKTEELKLIQYFNQSGHILGLLSTSIMNDPSIVVRGEADT